MEAQKSPGSVAAQTEAELGVRPDQNKDTQLPGKITMQPDAGGGYGKTVYFLAMNQAHTGFWTLLQAGAITEAEYKALTEAVNKEAYKLYTQSFTTQYH